MNRALVVLLLCYRFFDVTSASAAESEITLLKTPNHGIQPQAVVDAKGNLHLLYFQGDAKAGNLMYVRRAAGQKDFFKPVRVNSQEGSAIAMGTIRGGQIALGKNDRIHVAWNGSMQALPKNPLAGMPMLYARLNDAGTAFEPQRNLMTQTSVLDGGGTLTADRAGNVYVAWHALGKDAAKGEDNRQVWMSISDDEGRTFALEKAAWDEKTGACGCCGMRGFTDQQGRSYFLYRSASAKVERGMFLLQSPAQGLAFIGTRLDTWNIATCPMSSEAIAEGPGGIYTAWDNDEQIYFTRLVGGDKTVAAPKPLPGKGPNRKHPALAVNKKGEVLLAWTENTAWNRGGNLVWQVFDPLGQPLTSSERRVGAIPVWGLPAAVANEDGSFLILH